MSTPHPAPDKHRLAQVQDETLHRMIDLRRGGIVARARLYLAGVPSLVALEAERQRRERIQHAVAS